MICHVTWKDNPLRVTIENFAISVISTHGSLVFSLIKPMIGLGGIFTRGSRNSVIKFLSIIE